MKTFKRVLLATLLLLSLLFAAKTFGAFLGNYCAGVRVDSDSDGLYDSCDVSDYKAPHERLLGM